MHVEFWLPSHRQFDRYVLSPVHRIVSLNHRVWVALFVLVGATVFWTKRSEIALIGSSLRSANPIWLILVIVLSLAMQSLFATMLRGSVSAFGSRVSFRHAIDAQLRRESLGVSAPGGGLAGTLLTVRRFEALGVPPVSTLSAMALFGLIGRLSFAFVLVPAVIWLGVNGSVSLGVEIIAIAFAIVFAALFVVSVFSLRSPRLMEGLPRAIRDRISPDDQIARLNPRRLALPGIAALAGDLTAIAMLFAALCAVGEPAAIGIAAGGYAVGTLFMMIAPVFQGIGIVEVSMIVALNRMGVAHAQAVEATMVFRAGEIWLPVAIGVMLHARNQPGLRRSPAHLPALLTAFTGLLSVLSVMAPRIPVRFNRFEDYSLFDPADASRTLALVGGSCLLMLSYGLWRRRRTAWLAALAFSAIVAIAHLAKHHDQDVALLASANIALLICYGRRFRVRGDLPSLRRGVIGFAASLVFALLYGTTGFWLLDRREFGLDFTITDSAARTLRLYFSLSNSGLLPHTRYAIWFLDSLSIVGVLAAVSATFFLVRPLAWRHRTLPQERLEARRLVERSGRSSLDAFKSADDKFFFFSADRSSVIAYGLAFGTAVVLGDPVAPTHSAFSTVLDEFLDFADANGWYVAFHQAGTNHLDAYLNADLTLFKIGEEAIVDLQTFTLSGNSMKGLRAAMNRATREGLTTRLYRAPLSDALLGELRIVSEEWLTLPNRRERGFTLGQWSDDIIQQCDAMVARAAGGDVLGFVNLVRDGVPGEATFDLMRHRRDAPSNTMDMLIVALIGELRSAGYSRLSLGLAPWSDVGASADASLLERGVGALTPHFGRFFSVQGLRMYKEKFRPRWEPRYLIVRSESALPRVALALLRLTEHEDGTDSGAREAAPRRTLIHA